MTYPRSLAQSGPERQAEWLAEQQKRLASLERQATRDIQLLRLNAAGAVTINNGANVDGPSGTVHIPDASSLIGIYIELEILKANGGRYRAFIKDSADFSGGVAYLTHPSGVVGSYTWIATSYQSAGYAAWPDGVERKMGITNTGDHLITVNHNYDSGSGSMTVRNVSAWIFVY